MVQLHQETDGQICMTLQGNDRNVILVYSDPEFFNGCISFSVLSCYSANSFTRVIVLSHLYTFIIYSVSPYIVGSI